MQTLLNKIKSFRYAEVIFGVCIFLIGLLTIFFPQTAIRIIGLGLGILLLIIGASRMVTLFSTKDEGMFFTLRFIGNLFFLFCAIGLLFFAGRMANFVCTVCGIYLIVDASTKLFPLIVYKHKRNASFYTRVILSTLILLFGLALVVAPGAIVNTAFRLVGVSLAFEGGSTVVYAVLRLRERREKARHSTDPIEGRFIDKSDT
jgi:uncharacterized membrane protein HdeD (DUF308 family)